MLLNAKALIKHIFNEVVDRDALVPSRLLISDLYHYGINNIKLMHSQNEKIEALCNIMPDICFIRLIWTRPRMRSEHDTRFSPEVY